MRLSSMATAALQEEIQLALRYGHGEPTVLDKNGRVSFNVLQHRPFTGSGDPILRV
jgi:hypothetical protein